MYIYLPFECLKNIISVRKPCLWILECFKICAMPRFSMDWSSRDTPCGRSGAWATPLTRAKGPGSLPVSQGQTGPLVPSSWTNLVYKFGDFQETKPNQTKSYQRHFHTKDFFFN